MFRVGCVMLTGKALGLLLAWAFVMFVIAGFAKGLWGHLLMFGLTPVLAFAVLEESAGRGLKERGRFFYKGYFGSERFKTDSWLFGIGVLFGGVIALRRALEW